MRLISKFHNRAVGNIQGLRNPKRTYAKTKGRYSFRYYHETTPIRFRAHSLEAAFMYCKLTWPGEEHIQHLQVFWAGINPGRYVWVIKMF